MIRPSLYFPALVVAAILLSGVPSESFGQDDGGFPGVTVTVEERYEEVGHAFVAPIEPVQPIQPVAPIAPVQPIAAYAPNPYVAPSYARYPYRVYANQPRQAAVSCQPVQHSPSSTSIPVALQVPTQTGRTSTAAYCVPAARYYVPAVTVSSPSPAPTSTPRTAIATAQPTPTRPDLFVALLFLSLVGLPLIGLLASVGNEQASTPTPVVMEAALSPDRQPSRRSKPAPRRLPGPVIAEVLSEWSDTDVNDDRYANLPEEAAQTLRDIERQRDGQIEAIRSSTLDPVTKEFMISDIRSEFDARVAGALRSFRF